MPDHTKAGAHSTATATQVLPEEPGKGAKKGLRVPRRWTRQGINPFDELTWELRTASITNEKGEVVFE